MLRIILDAFSVKIELGSATAALGLLGLFPRSSEGSRRIHGRCVSLQPTNRRLKQPNHVLPRPSPSDHSAPSQPSAAAAFITPFSASVTLVYIWVSQSCLGTAALVNYDAPARYDHPVKLTAAPVQPRKTNSILYGRSPIMDLQLGCKTATVRYSKLSSH
jgi:hypothetical protein